MGVEVVPKFGFTREGGAYVAAEKAEYLPLTELAAEFLLRARHLAMAGSSPLGPDLGAVAIATGELAQAEDKLVIGGLLAGAGSSAPLGAGTPSVAPLRRWRRPSPSCAGQALPAPMPR